MANGLRFLPAEQVGIKVCTATSTKALARIVPDAAYSAMWRLVRADGSLSDMANLARAKDAALDLARKATPQPVRKPVAA